MLGPTLRRPLLVILVSLVAASGLGRAPALAQESMSASLAEELAALMAERQLEAVAGTDSAEDDRFVAAMYIPGQLLVVSARYSAPDTAELKITNREFREVYMDLNAASIAGTKILITDTQANGLQADDDTADMVDRGDGILRFDDDPEAQDLSRDEYRNAFVEADGQYARMLEVLIASARGDTGDSALAQESVSTPLAAELSKLMTERQLSATASKDTVDDDRFVAALSFPGQLLVVSARYSPPFIMEKKIADGQFQEVYLDLNGASIAGTKIQITDAGANGLRAADETVDVIDQGTGLLRLDGNPGGQDMSRIEYRDAAADADGQYTRILRALLAGVR